MVHKPIFPASPKVESSTSNNRLPLKEALKLKDRLVFMDFITDQTENVWPMVKAGKGLSEMLLGSEDL